jgi:hypothetical protein
MTRPVLRASDAVGETLALPPLDRRPADLLPPRKPPATLLATYRERLEADGYLDAEQIAEAVGAFAVRWTWRYRTGARVCTACERRKPLSAFGPNYRAPDACASRCRKCDAARTRARRARAPYAASASSS